MLPFRIKPATLLLGAYLFWGLAIISLSPLWGGAPTWWPTTRAIPQVGAMVIGSITVAAACWFIGQSRAGQDMVRDATDAAERITAVISGENPYSNHDRSGAAVAALTGTLQRAIGLSAKAVATIVALVSIPLVVAILLAAAFSPLLGALCLLNALIPPLTIRTFSRLIRRSTTANQRASRQLTSRFLDLVRGIDTAAYFQAARNYAADIERLAITSRDETMRLLAINQVIIFILDLIMYGWQIGSLAWLGSATGIPPAQLLTVVALATLLLLPIDQAGIFFVAGFGGITATKQLRALVKDLPDQQQPQTPNWVLTPSQGVGVSARDVVLAYPGQKTEIKCPNLQIEAGEHVVIFGPSGCGKSTLALALAGLLPPRSGQLLIEGSPPGLNRSIRVAVVGQTPWVWQATILENLRLARPDLELSEAENLLQQVGLLVELGPNWAEIELRDGGRGLSGGQLQRLALAQALATDPQLLIADEVTSAIDARSQEIVLRTLAHSRATVIQIAHRSEIIAGASRAIEFAQPVEALR